MACCGCLACVERSTVGMVEKWGRFSYVAQPGLHCLNPFLGEWMAGRLSLRVQSLDVRCDTKTKVCNQKMLQDFFIAYHGLLCYGEDFFWVEFIRTWKVLAD